MRQMTLPEKILSFFLGNFSTNLIYIKRLRRISPQLDENIDDEISSKPTGRWLFTLK
jgi:hypothetical protein